MINDLTIKIGKNIDFSHKYQKILDNYPADRKSNYRLNIDEVIEYIQSLGYHVMYYKSARFFRVDIGKCSNGEDVYCDFTISDSRFVHKRQKHENGPYSRLFTSALVQST